LVDQSTIVVATNNLGKLKEFALLLPSNNIISQSSLNITPEEELGETFFENSLQKARVANAASNMPSLGDDSGLIVPALNNLPGLRSARYAHQNATDEENRQHLKKELEALDLNQTKAYFVCVLVW
jgi:XTP/dITP diphosphohydrolase